MSNRKVKCRFCEQFTIQKDAFKVVVNGKNEYYCNESHYKEAKQYKEDRQKILEICCDIFDYNVSKDTYFLKELKDVLGCTKSDTLKYYLEDNIIDLDVALSKDFATMVFKIKYFFAIVKRGLAQYEKQKKIEDNEKILSSNIEIYSYKYKPRKQKKTWMEIIKERN